MGILSHGAIGVYSLECVCVCSGVCVCVCVCVFRIPACMIIVQVIHVAMSDFVRTEGNGFVYVCMGN